MGFFGVFVVAIIWKATDTPASPPQTVRASNSGDSSWLPLINHDQQQQRNVTTDMSISMHHFILYTCIHAYIIWRYKHYFNISYVHIHEYDLHWQIIIIRSDSSQFCMIILNKLLHSVHRCIDQCNTDRKNSRHSLIKLIIEAVHRYNKCRVVSCMPSGHRLPLLNDPSLSYDGT